MREVEIHIHGVYWIEIEDDADLQEEVQQSFIAMMFHDPDFKIESFKEVKE